MNKTLFKTRGFFRGLIQSITKSNTHRNQATIIVETSRKTESRLRFLREARACRSSLKEHPQLADTVLSV
jgi:hypothetical protein